MLLQSKPELVLWPDTEIEFMTLVWVTPETGEIVVQEPGARCWGLVEISVLVMTIYSLGITLDMSRLSVVVVILRILSRSHAVSRCHYNPLWTSSL